MAIARHQGMWTFPLSLHAINVSESVSKLIREPRRWQTHDDQAQLLTRLAELLASVPTTRAWKSRVMLGPWDVRGTTMSMPITMVFANPIPSWYYRPSGLVVACGTYRVSQCR